MIESINVAVIGRSSLTELDSTLIPEEYTSNIFETYHRVEINHQIFSSASYLRANKRNSYTVSFNLLQEKMFGRIQSFVILSPGLGVSALISILEPIATPAEWFQLDNPSLDYCCRIIPVKNSGIWKLIPVNDIINKCIFMDFSKNGQNYMYVAEMDVDILID